jgi:hypothetical protein
MNVIGNPRGGKKFAAQIVTVNLLVAIQRVRLPFEWFSLNKFFGEACQVFLARSKNLDGELKSSASVTPIKSDKNVETCCRKM